MDHFFFKGVFGDPFEENDLGDLEIAGVFFLEPLASVYFEIKRGCGVRLKGLLVLRA